MSRATVTLYQPTHGRALLSYLREFFQTRYTLWPPFSLFIVFQSLLKRTRSSRLTSGASFETPRHIHILRRQLQFSVSHPILVRFSSLAFTYILVQNPIQTSQISRPLFSDRCWLLASAEEECNTFLRILFTTATLFIECWKVLLLQISLILIPFVLKTTSLYVLILSWNLLSKFYDRSD